MLEAHFWPEVFAISHEINPNAISYHEIEFDSLLKWVKYGLLGKAASACHRKGQSLGRYTSRNWWLPPYFDVLLSVLFLAGRLAGCRERYSPFGLGLSDKHTKKLGGPHGIRHPSILPLPFIPPPLAATQNRLCQVIKQHSPKFAVNHFANYLAPRVPNNFLTQPSSREQIHFTFLSLPLWYTNPLI